MARPEFRKWLRQEDIARSMQIEAVIAQYKAQQYAVGRKLTLFEAMAELIEAGAKGKVLGAIPMDRPQEATAAPAE